MNLEERLNSGAFNLADMGRKLWPNISDKSAVIKLKNKLNKINGQRITDKDAMLIDNYILINMAGLDLDNLLTRMGFKKILGIYEFKHGTTHLSIEIANDKYFLFDGRPEIQSNYQEGCVSELDMAVIAKMLANYGRNLLRSY